MPTVQKHVRTRAAWPPSETRKGKKKVLMKFLVIMLGSKLKL
jgi:hypothetical protein